MAGKATQRPSGPAAQAYKYLDYAWLQYAAIYRKRGETVRAAIDSQKTIAVKLNVGLALSLNMANGGLRTNLGDGVIACWDADRSAGTLPGLVIGSPNGTGYNEGQKVPCSPAPPSAQNLMVNPALIRKIVDEAKTDRDIPFVLYWARPESGTASGFLDPYVSVRTDFVSAFDYGITEGAKRTVFNGYRTPKPYP